MLNTVDMSEFIYFHEVFIPKTKKQQRFPHFSCHQNEKELKYNSNKKQITLTSGKLIISPTVHSMLVRRQGLRNVWYWSRAPRAPRPAPASRPITARGLILIWWRRVNASRWFVRSLWRNTSKVSALLPWDTVTLICHTALRKREITLSSLKNSYIPRFIPEGVAEGLQDIFPKLMT
jgi:hypothetical protein